MPTPTNRPYVAPTPATTDNALWPDIYRRADTPDTFGEGISIMPAASWGDVSKPGPGCVQANDDDTDMFGFALTSPRGVSLGSQIRAWWDVTTRDPEDFLLILGVVLFLVVCVAGDSEKWALTVLLSPFVLVGLAVGVGFFVRWKGDGK